MEKELKIDYDVDKDTLYLYSEEEVKGSFELDMFIFDISKTNDLAGIEILEASKVISSLIEKEISKEELLKLNKAKIKYNAIDNLLFITIEFNLPNEHINIPLSIANPMSVYV